VEKEDASQATGDLSTRFGDNCTRCKGFVNVVFLAENSEIEEKIATFLYKTPRGGTALAGRYRKNVSAADTPLLEVVYANDSIGVSFRDSISRISKKYLTSTFLRLAKIDKLSILG
jgi:hypothetical protein